MLYMIGCAELDVIKFGFSRFPEKRLKGLQTAFPYDLYVLAVKDGLSYSHKSEKYLHLAMKEYSMRGEWYPINNQTLWIINILFGINGKGLKTYKKLAQKNNRAYRLEHQRILKTFNIPENNLLTSLAIVEKWFTNWDVDKPSEDIKNKIEQWSRLITAKEFRESA